MDVSLKVSVKKPPSGWGWRLSFAIIWEAAGAVKAILKSQPTPIPILLRLLLPSPSVQLSNLFLHLYLP